MKAKKITADMPVKELLTIRRHVLDDIRAANRRIAEIDKVLRSHGIDPKHPADRRAKAPTR